MKNVVDQLTKKERETLINWYSTDSYEAVRKLIDLERLELAKDHVDQVDILHVRYLSGQTASLKKFIETIQRLYKSSKQKS